MEIQTRRDNHIAAHGHTTQGCEGLDWQNVDWCKNFNRIVWRVLQISGITRGYSSWINEDNFPGMLWPYDDWLEYSDPQHNQHPLKRWTTGHDTAGTKVPSNYKTA